MREKYGMEFRKPKWDEQPDEGLVGGHEWKIFPLLHRRRVFADVENFLLFDFYRTDGGVDENVFAYSNRFNEERGLIVYHNRYAETRGWIKTSAAYVDKASGDLRQKSLAEGLGSPYEGYVIFRDMVTHLEYIRSCAELWQKGLYFELAAYQCHTFLDWRFVGEEGWDQVYDALGGSGVESVQAKWDELFARKEEKPAAKKRPRPRELPNPKPPQRRTGPKVEPAQTESAEAPAVKTARKPRKTKTRP